jgi:hypothetical protein
LADAIYDLMGYKSLAFEVGSEAPATISMDASIAIADVGRTGGGVERHIER